jgi:serine/threonine-protein kinase
MLMRNLSGSMPLAGDVIAGKYRIEGVAGEGGMGIVYEAEHVVLGQRVAVKVLLPDGQRTPEAMERFCMEARVAARIESDHVVRIMDAASLPTGEPYLVMEYLSGCDLKALLEERRTLPAPEAVDYMLQALEALAHAHAHGVIHRDLKPANLFVATLTDGRQVLKLLDFGISKSFTAPHDNPHSGPRIYGSPGYMSPEQLRDVAVGPASDVWSLGVVLYELLSGVAPFDHEQVSEVVAAILSRSPTPLHERAPSIPAELSAIVTRCLQKETTARWASTAELATALAPFGSGAWQGAVERIERVLARAKRTSPPIGSSQKRRFESLDHALQCLESPGAAADDGTAVSLASTLPPAGSSPQTSTLCILLIDDSESTRLVHEDLLRKAGFEVRATPSAEHEARLEGWAPHLVLIDVKMPNADGDALCCRVKMHVGASIPVVLVAEDVDDAGFVEYVRTLCAITYSPEDLPP